MQKLLREDRSAGWYVTRELDRSIRLARLWKPSGIREPIRPDHYTQATAEFPLTRFEIGWPSKGARLLALTILLGRFDWSIAWDFHEYFAADWIVPMRLLPGQERFISKGDISAWWAYKEDIAIGLLEPITTYGVGQFTKPTGGRAA